MIEKAVLPAAGLGTRLLPMTKEQPKEMLPVFTRNQRGLLCIKPMINLVFDQLYEKGFRKYCFVVGREKRAIEDFFTPDSGYTTMLKAKRNIHACELDTFYSKLNQSSIMWINQPEPQGFGQAVLTTKPFVNDDSFLVYAGDTYIVSSSNDILDRLLRVWQDLDLDAAFIVQEVANPSAYGVILGEETSGGLFKIRQAVEKPNRHISNLAIMAVYLFKPAIFKALETVKPGKGGETQLTDAIQQLIDWGMKVYAVKLRPDELMLDVGSSETYWEALSISYKQCFKELYYISNESKDPIIINKQPDRKINIDSLIER